MIRRIATLTALVLACALCLANPARAEKRALILAIADYVRQPLPGVAKDVENASEMARLMGIPAANIEIWRDKELAGTGLLKALEDFTAQVRPEDHVFVYYSGHGSSYTKRGTANVCEKALVAQDITMISKEEFHKRLNKLAAKVEKTFVFMDACYSGGLVELNDSRTFGLGGSGDVLAGVMAACLARGIPPLMAACLGVYWHALSGALLARDFPGRGNLPTEIAHTLPIVLKERTPC